MLCKIMSSVQSAAPKICRRAPVLLRLTAYGMPGQAEVLASAIYSFGSLAQVGTPGGQGGPTPGPGPRAAAS